jgi:uncharacterized protein (TIGR01319 family)
MTTSLIDAESMLVIDVGSINTRALLFDVVDNRYRFLAAGGAATTAAAPYNDIGEGVRRAIDHLQTITGRSLVDSRDNLIMPAKVDGSGIDAFVATMSAGPALTILVVGLLEDVSLETACRLATTTYCNTLETISLNDRRKTEARIDLILRLRPDMIIVAGGTEGGASQSVLKLMDAVGLACYLIPEAQRPEVLYAGNQDLRDEVEEGISNLVHLHFAPNVRPVLDDEQLDAAQVEVAKIYGHVRARNIPGVQELNEWAKGELLPTSAAFGRLIRFLSKTYASSKGVLGVDIGASALTLSAAFGGDLIMGVYPQLGLGAGVYKMLEQVRLEEVSKWLHMDIAPVYLRDYIYNKALRPDSLPYTQEDLAIEQALARVAMRVGVKRIAAGFPQDVAFFGTGLLPWLEPILATGSVLTQAPSLAQTMLMLLDGLQPTGITTIVLDQNHLAAALGAAAARNAILAVQVLDSNTFLYLGTVIAPVGVARAGTPILKVKMVYESGHETSLEIKQGALEVLPLPVGQTARLHLQPLHRFDVGMGGPGRSGKLGVHGGALGVVIDARGRPLNLPDQPTRRYELFKKWLWALGG